MDVQVVGVVVNGTDTLMIAVPERPQIRASIAFKVVSSGSSPRKLTIR
jgi:hypothetical protein